MSTMRANLSRIVSGHQLDRVVVDTDCKLPELPISIAE